MQYELFFFFKDFYLGAKTCYYGKASCNYNFYVK